MASSIHQTIGFVGLGIMGTPMAGHLIKAGHEVFLFSIPAVPAALVEAGGNDRHPFIHMPRCVAKVVRMPAMVWRSSRLREAVPRAPLPAVRHASTSTKGRNGSTTSSARLKALVALAWLIPNAGSKPTATNARATIERITAYP